MNNLLAIDVTLARSAIKGLPLSTDAEVQAAMESGLAAIKSGTINSVTIDSLYRGSLGAVLVEAQQRELMDLEQRLNDTVAGLNAMNAMLSGVPVDIGRINFENLLPVGAWVREWCKANGVNR